MRLLVWRLSMSSAHYACPHEFGEPDNGRLCNWSARSTVIGVPFASCSTRQAARPPHAWRPPQGPGLDQYDRLDHVGAADRKPIHLSRAGYGVLATTAFVSFSLVSK